MLGVNGRKIKKSDMDIARMCVSGFYSIPEAAKKLKMTPSQATYFMMRSLRKAYQLDHD